MLSDGVYLAHKIFASKEWLIDHEITIVNGVIVSLQPMNQSLDQVIRHFNCLIPAFVDIQIYGAGEKLFSMFPEVDALKRLHDYCVGGKAHHFMPTVATNTMEVFYKCIDAVREYWAEGGEGCLGLHLEGPWISEEKRGAHTLSDVRTNPTVEEVREVLVYGKGVIKIITIAPEVVSLEVIELIRSYDIVISAGHSNANYETATDFFNTGHIHTCTHLFNAMSAFGHRSPGLVGAVFNHPAIRSSIVPDGYHVDFAAIQVAKKIMGERLFVITDAVTTTLDGPYPHILVGDKYESNNILSGSALTMEKAVCNLHTKCGIDLEEAFRMCSLYPAQVLGLESDLGVIEVGRKAVNIVEWTLKCCPV